MADVPHEAPHNAVKGGLAKLKKLPPMAWVLIAVGLLVVIMYLRHRSAQAAATQSADNASATADQASQDASNYGADTSGADSAYLAGYDSGMYSGAGGMGMGLGPSIFGGAGPSGNFLPNGTGADAGGAPNMAPDIAIPGTNVPALTPSEVNNFTFLSGGGAPKRPPVHSPPPKAKPVAAGPHGAIAAPSGHKKPPPRKGYRIVGTGGGGWIYVPNRARAHH